MKTRPAHSEDLDFLTNLFLSSMQEAITAARGHWDSHKEGAQFRQQLDLDATQVIQAGSDDVGCLMTHGLPGRVIEVHTLCVAVDHQSAGLGTMVMRELMDNALSDGSSIELSVLKANPRAKAFYARLGFVEIGESPTHIRMRWPNPP